MFGVPELAVILVIILVVFGPGKLPSLGSALGKGLKNFRKTTEEANNLSEETRRLGTPEDVKPQGVETETTSSERPNIHQ